MKVVTAIRKQLRLHLLASVNTDQSSARLFYTLFGISCRKSNLSGVHTVPELKCCVMQIITLLRFLGVILGVYLCDTLSFVAPG